MAFMKIQTEHGIWYKVEVNGETHYVPPGLVSLDIQKGETATLEGMIEAERDEVEGADEIDDLSHGPLCPYRVGGECLCRRSEILTAISEAEERGREKFQEMVNSIQDYVGPKMKDLDEVEIEAWKGWGAQFHAPGYMDQTDWVLGDTEAEAVAECKEMFGSEEDEEDEDEDDEDEEVSDPDGECQNCAKVWAYEKMKPIKDINQRVAPGEPMPCGECPECGALCQPVTSGSRVMKAYRVEVPAFFFFTVDAENEVEAAKLADDFVKACVNGLDFGTRGDNRQCTIYSDIEGEVEINEEGEIDDETAG